jgi:hypothetical protein
MALYRDLYTIVKLRFLMEVEEILVKSVYKFNFPVVKGWRQVCFSFKI